MSKIALTGNASGTGTLTIAAPSTNTDRTLTLPDSAGTMMLTNTGVTTAQMPAGSVLQVVSTTKTSFFSSSSNTLVDITGLSAVITPSSTSNKILISVFIPYSNSSYINTGFVNTYFVLADGSNNVITQGDAYGNRNRGIFGGNQFYAGGNLNSASAQYLWSPSTTSSTTVKVRGACSSDTFCLPATYNEDNHGGYGNNAGIATITLMEIAA